ncbi:FxsA family protein [Paraferrimonas haliotis]|uniref:Membrane protein FxsA n=1 Tax=Paraferrimonas haliotis TaxID=2013866 RepID=A0AA37WWC7_9GAMM|nr:FxsA family protein [Paraferrimonas haliotis]GLS83327.1 membrane protein FxsA [Paraferrimonas haliotis]
MLGVLVLAFILVPIIEIAVIIQVGGWLGAPATIAFMVITAIIGASLVRDQGLKTLFSVQSRLNRGELPGLQIVEGILLAVAGVLLVTPGFVTDLVGFTLLLPPTRQLLAHWLLARMQVQMVNHASANPYAGANPHASNDSFDKQQGDTIDGEFERKD